MAACILPNTFDYYKSKALDLLPSDAKDILTDKYVGEVLGSKALQYFADKDRSANKNFDAIGVKALISGYIAQLKKSDDKNTKRFIPNDVNEKLVQELVNIQIGTSRASNYMAVDNYIKKVKSSIVTEAIKDSGNVDVKQDLTLADYGVETTNGPQDLLSKWHVWVKSNPHGIVAYRTNMDKFSDPKYALKTRSMGNPFMGWQEDGQKDRDTNLFRDWLLTGNNAGNSLATEELRQAYLQLINDAAKNNAKVLYYTNISPSQSHASVIGDLIKQGGFDTKQNTPQPTVAKNATTKFNVSNAEFYSGAAEGSDTEWGKQARKLGIKVIDYKVENFDKLSDDWKARIEKEYLESRAFLGKRPIKGDTYGGKLTRRDMMQADEADAIFAIAERIVNPGGIEYSGGKEYTNNTDHDNVQGGTANAVARGILRGIPIYVYDQSDNQWKQWNAKSKSFEAINDVPTLTQHAAVIGTRGINDDGKKAVTNVLNKTLGKEYTTQQSTTKPKSKPKNKSTSKNETITSEKINSTQIYSNYDAAGQIFGNGKSNMQTDELIKDVLDKGDYEAMIVYTSSSKFASQMGSIQDMSNTGKDVNNKMILRINPSDEEVRRIIMHHNKIAVIRDKNTPGKKIENLYKNVKIKQTQARVQNWFENKDMLLFQNKINDLFIKNNQADLQKEAVMYRVLQDLQKEYGAMTDEEKQGFKGEKIKTLIDNFDHISSLVTVNEEIDEFKMDEYDSQDEEDVLYSEQHSTSNMPKDKMLQGLLMSFKTGKEDELGTPLYYEPMVINNIICRYVSGSKDSDDMMKRITKASRKNKFMKTLIENLEKDESGRLKSILFTKYANLYKSDYLTVNGNRTIDEGTSFASSSINVGYVSDETKEKFEGVTLLSVEGIKGLQTVHSFEDLKLDPSMLEIYQEAGMSNDDIWNSMQEGMLDLGKTGYDFNNEKLRSYLGLVGLETNPDEHDFDVLSDDEMTLLKENLAMIYTLADKDYADLDDTQSLKKDYKQYYENILNILNSMSQQKTESIIRAPGEAVFVYADKNYINKIVDGVRDDRDQFMKDEFLQYELFTSSDITNKEANPDGDYNKAASAMYSSLLRELATSKDTNWFRVQSFFVNKDKDSAKKYNDLTTEELHDINRKIFYKEEISNRMKAKNGMTEYIYVHSPIYADKGSLHYYRVPKVSLDAKQNPDGTWQEPQILTDIKRLILLETNRIKTAKERAILIKNGKLEPIDVYDTVNGEKGRAETYCFQPMLNEYGTNEKGKKVSLYDMLAAIKAEEIDDADKQKKIDALIHDAACDIIGQIFDNDVKNIEPIRYKNAEGKEKQAYPHRVMLNNLRKGRYESWNKRLNWFRQKDLQFDDQGILSGYASDSRETEFTQIEYAINTYIRQADLQQLTISDPALYKNDVEVQKRYAQVQAGYQRPDTKAKNGREWMRTLYLKDDKISLSDEELKQMEYFLNEAKEKLGLNIDVKGIVESFKKINVADAQCYRSLSSYRSVRSMFGQWSSKDEELYEKIKKGEPLTADDYSQVWQTLKPFVYTQQDSEWKDAQGNARHNKVGYQYKNSENVLFNMYMLFSKDEAKRTKLGELNRFMEQYEIDTVQFESAVKVGREGLIDLNNIDADNVFDYLVEKTGVNKEQEQKCKSGLQGNPHVVHEIPYKEYGIKTSTPPHMFDTEQQLGSQLKKLLQGDIPDDASVYLDTDCLFVNADDILSLNTELKLKLFDEDIEFKKEKQPDGTVKICLDKENYLKLFNGLMSDIMLDGYGEVQEIFKSKENLSDALQELMKGSPKYDFDIKQALKIGKNGDFQVDPRNPAIKDKIVVLMTSILKNRINKQLTRGGTAIQMACWGGSDVMHEDGTYGPLKIVRNPDGTIRYMECLMPAYSKQWVESMMNKDGVLDPKKCKDDNLLKALCYRVPTEDIYSMIPLKIVGFTPLQFGTNIMLPKEITTLTGSDFDVDKMYLFLPEFELKDKWAIDPKIARERFEKSLVSKTAKYEADVEIKNTNKQRSDNGEAELTDDEKAKIQKRITNDYFNAYCVEQKYKIQQPRYIQFDASKDISENSGEAKRNLLLSLMRGAISSPYNITKEQNPGGFDYLKDLASKVNPEVNKPMNLTESQYLNFFNLNMTGRKLIGIYANHNVAHALCQGSGLAISEKILIDGKQYQSLSEIYDSSKRRISRNIAEFLAASVDNAKDPVLAKLWQNDKTASTTCFLLRLGVPPATIMDIYKKLQGTKEFKNFMKFGVNQFKKNASEYMATVDLNNAKNFFAFLGKYADTIQNLETINLMLKSDSSNGAMYDIADIIDKQVKLQNLRADKNLVAVDNVLPDYEEDTGILVKSKKEIFDQIKENGSVKSYKLAYYLTYCNFRKYFGEVIDRTMLDNAIAFGRQLPRFSADDIKKFITQYSKQQLRYLDYFKPKIKKQPDGTFKIITTQEIIDKTLEEIPQKLNEYKRKYKGNAFVEMLTKVENNDGTEYLMIPNIADMRFETVNDMKAAFNKMYSKGGLTSTDAVDLIHYTLCINGFGYDPRSFLSLIPIKTLAKQKGMEQLYQFFEIDHIDDFEDNFILDNDLVETVDRKVVKKSNKVDGFVLLPNTTSKIIMTKSGYDKETHERVDEQYYKKVYETEDGSGVYMPVEVDEIEDGKMRIVADKKDSSFKKDIYEILDKEVVSSDLASDRDETLKNMTESVIKSYYETNTNLKDIDKETIMKVISSSEGLGRYFNLDADPMSIYDPIAIEFC